MLREGKDDAEEGGGCVWSWANPKQKSGAGQCSTALQGRIREYIT
jgi:hypothetical protein